MTPDPFEMLSDGPENSFQRAERAFELHQRAVEFRSRVMPVTDGEAQEVVALGPLAVAHPAASRGVANGMLLLLSALCDGVAHRLSPGLFETD